MKWYMRKPAHATKAITKTLSVTCIGDQILYKFAWIALFVCHGHRHTMDGF